MLSAVAAAALTGVCATAQAQVLVEIEGPMSAYTADSANSGTMTVMNNSVAVTAATAFVSPTENRDELLARRINGQRVLNQAGAVYNVSNWMRGDTFFGRRARGFLGATVIVTGTVDPASGKITAEEVFSDVAENVVLGAINNNVCTNQRCNAAGDYIRGNGPTGPVFIPNKDNRLPALPITDAGLFELNMTNKSFNTGPDGAPVVTTFGGEGYFSDLPIHNGVEQAIVYYAFELGEARPDLLLNPGIPEISSLRIRCTEGGRMEVRGFVHAPVNPDGTPLGGDFRTGIPNPTNGGQGRIRVEMDVNGDGVISAGETFFGDDATTPTADELPTYGGYRLRQDMDQCGSEATVYWDRPNTTVTPWAVVENVPVDRLREE